MEKLLPLEGDATADKVTRDQQTSNSTLQGLLVESEEQSMQPRSHQAFDLQLTLACAYAC
jgi:hypothetical protein